MNLQRFFQKTQKFQIQQLNISNGFFPQKNLWIYRGFILNSINPKVSQKNSINLKGFKMIFTQK